MLEIAFDESGNTGADLLNKQQPVFVLASADYTREEARDIIVCAYTHQSREAKFSSLKKSNAGVRRITEVITSLCSEKERFKTTIVHKKFMILAKIVDIIVETLAHRDGIDLYERGANIAISNMHYHCMPAFCGRQRVDDFFRAFVEMIRRRSKAEIDEFYYKAWQLHAASIDRQYSNSFGPILASEQMILDILDSNGPNSIDPAIPAFFEHCASWGDRIGGYFDVLHDDSKPIFQEKELLEHFMSKDIPHAIIGYDRRKYGFPLKANGVHFADSKADERLQVVDILAGSLAYWATGIAKDERESRLWKELEGMNIQQFMGNVLWPSTNVSPEDLGTDGIGGINAVDYITDHLKKRNNKTNKAN